MQFSKWLPIYTAILEDFGLSPSRDEEGARLLAALLRDRQGLLAEARGLVRGRRAVVFGNAPSLEAELDCMLSNPREREGAALLAADGAAAALLRRGIVPDIVVTDLDGPAEALALADSLGSIMVVHAHGDNIDALARMVPRLDRVIGTCQCRPRRGSTTSEGSQTGTDASFSLWSLGLRQSIWLASTSRMSLSHHARERSSAGPES